MPDYSKMSDEAFGQILAEILDEHTGSAILTIPGVYEVVSEHFNNEVLDRWAAKHTEAEIAKG